MSDADEIAAPHAFRRSAVRRLWMALSGLAIAIAFLEPRAWPLAWLGLAPVFALAPHAPRLRAAFVDGWIAGVAANGAACAWLIETIHRFGGFSLATAIFFYAALIAYTGIPLGLTALLLRYAGKRAPILLAPCLWVAIEFLFPNFFPWRLAHSQRALIPLIQVGDLTGPYGLSFIVAWFASAASRARRHPRALQAPLIATAILFSYGEIRLDWLQERLAHAAEARVGIVQGNLSLFEKRRGDLFRANVERYRRLSRSIEPSPDLLVWPETVVGWPIARDTRSLGALDPFPGAPAPLVFGAIGREDSGDGTRWYNSAFVRATDGRVIGRYDKIVLMPFGEFMPFATTFPWLKELSPNTGDFTPGEGPVVIEITPELRIAPLVCYDDLLAEHVRRAGRDGATLLVTLANDAWFDDSAALRLHESLALWRAIENRRFFVRATNTGLTSVIAPSGRVTLELPTWTETVAEVRVRLLSMPTPYQKVGDLFAWLAVAGAALLLLRSRWY